MAPGALAALLDQSGFGGTKLTILEALGGPRERVRTARASGFALTDIDPLNVVALEVEASANARVLPRAAGLPDALFEHDGQITKREIRAVTLSSLAPRRNELLWDIGAGSGSVAIEWMLADPSAPRVLPSNSIPSAPHESGAMPRHSGFLRSKWLKVRRRIAWRGLPAPRRSFLSGVVRPQPECLI